MMAKYIDTDVLKADLAQAKLTAGTLMSCEVQKMMSFIDEQPAADVVEVVRCEKCKHFGYYETSFTASFINVQIPGCFKDGINRWREVKENGFCDMGERRE